jgi:2-keto-4-pentenoate hydratase
VVHLIDTLWQGMRTGTLPTTLPEASIDEGQRLQLELLQKWQTAGESLGGYKIGLTSGTSRNRFGAGIRPFGFILSSRIHQSGDCLELASIGQLGLENELVFRVAQDIATDSADRHLARSVIDAVAPGFEINQRRLTGPAADGIRVAENLTQWGIVAGHFVPLDQDFEALTVALYRDGELIEKTAADGHIDDHFESIAGLINRLYRFGLGLKKDQLLITGSYTRQTVDKPGTWVGDFEAIGKTEVVII